MNEKISVIMSVYNCEKTISKAIDSILNQTYTDWVMIICDDASTDNTYEIINEYKNSYPDKFIIIKNESNMKLPYSLNRCLEHVETDFIARMDGDDWSHPQRFEKQIEFLKKHPEIDLVGTGVAVSDGEKKIGSITKIPSPTKQTMTYQNAFSHATIMTYKRIYDQLGGYSLDKSVLRVEDVDLWCRFLSAGFKGYNLQDELYCILEDRAAVKRRTLSARINEAKTKSNGYKKMGFSGFVCIKPYFGILKAFIPFTIYKAIHAFKLKNNK